MNRITDILYRIMMLQILFSILFLVADSTKGNNSMSVFLDWYYTLHQYTIRQTKLNFSLDSNLLSINAFYTFFFFISFGHSHKRSSVLCILSERLESEKFSLFPKLTPLQRTFFVVMRKDSRVHLSDFQCYL